MSQIAVGKPIPDVAFHLTGDRIEKLSGFRGRTLVLFFYPKAGTPGCTQEGVDFKTAINKFRRQSAVILGASRDSLKAQENFKAKQEFPFDLAADPDETLCNIFDVIKQKNMYGKQVRGIERSTFIIDADGVLRFEWRKVKVKDHVNQVLAEIRALNA